MHEAGVTCRMNATGDIHVQYSSYIVHQNSVETHAIRCTINDEYCISIVALGHDIYTNYQTLHETFTAIQT